MGQAYRFKPSKLLWQYTELILHSYISTICPCNKCCCLIWSDAYVIYLEVRNNAKSKGICNAIDPELSSRLQLRSYHRNVDSYAFFINVSKVCFFLMELQDYFDFW